MARKPTPTALKKMRGTVQPCRSNKKEIDIGPVTQLPYAPRWFTPTQSKIYKTKGDQLKVMGLLTSLDFELFISFCKEYGDYIDTATQLNKIPLASFMNEADDYIFKRISKINRESWERSKALASEFGFTPSARAKMAMPGNDDPGDNDFD